MLESSVLGLRHNNNSENMKLIHESLICGGQATAAVQSSQQHVPLWFAPSSSRYFKISGRAG